MFDRYDAGLRVLTLCFLVFSIGIVAKKIMNKKIGQLKAVYKVKELFVARGFETEWDQQIDGTFQSSN